jgi:hypothetical protein
MMDAVACETSDDCGALKCIDGLCRDPFAVQQEEPKPLSNVTLGHKAWFGSGQGYGALVAAFDIGATTLEPLLMAATQSVQGEQQTILGIICFVPVTFAGSIVHWAHGRVGPGFISFFAWLSHVATTFVVGGLFGLAFEHGFEFNYPAAWAAGRRAHVARRVDGAHRPRARDYEFAIFARDHPDTRRRPRGAGGHVLTRFRPRAPRTRY